MKRHIFLLAAACALLTLPSCRFITISDELKQQMQGNNYGIHFESDENGESIDASDNFISQDEVTGEFHNLVINFPGDLVYTPGDCAFNISAPDNVLAHLSVKNENGTLTVKSDGTKFNKLKNVKISVSSPVLEEVTFNGAVDFDAPQGITALDFNATVNGAGDMSISGLKAGKVKIIVNGAGDVTLSKLESDELSLAINGAGDATVSGQTGNAEFSISGAGDIDALGLKAENISSKVRGIGKIKKPNN